MEKTGISYCYRCFHLIFAGEGRELVRPEPLPVHCPGCGGALEDDDWEWTGREDLRFCRQCGQIVDASLEDRDGFQIVAPEGP